MKVAEAKRKETEISLRQTVAPAFPTTYFFRARDRVGWKGRSVAGRVEMPSYELRFLGPDNQVITTKLIESTDDASAFTTAQQQVNGQAIEVWQGSHFIATIEAASAAPPEDDALAVRAEASFGSQDAVEEPASRAISTAPHS